MIARFAWLVLRLLEISAAIVERRNGDELVVCLGQDVHIVFELARCHPCVMEYFGTVKECGKTYHHLKIDHSTMNGLSFSYT